MSLFALELVLCSYGAFTRDDVKTSKRASGVEVLSHESFTMLSDSIIGNVLIQFCYTCCINPFCVMI